jgi:hypothetical protein
MATATAPLPQGTSTPLTLPPSAPSPEDLPVPSALLPQNSYIFIQSETTTGSVSGDVSGIFLNGVFLTDNPFAIQDGKSSNTSFYDDDGKLSLICFEKIPRTQLKNLPPGGVNEMYVVTRYENLEKSILSELGDDLMIYSTGKGDYGSIQSIIKYAENIEKTPSKDTLKILGLSGDIITKISNFEGDIVTDDVFLKSVGSIGIGKTLVKTLKRDYRGIILGSVKLTEGSILTKGLLSP